MKWWNNKQVQNGKSKKQSFGDLEQIQLVIERKLAQFKVERDSYSFVVT